MDFAQFDKTKFCGNMWAVHNGENKFVVTANFPERLFGLLPEKPSDDFDDEFMIEWVRCENVSEVFYTGGNNVANIKTSQEQPEDQQ
ncbi:hypothetical protein R7007_21715 [Vibrio sp. 1636]|uniref:Uncharacterized protein n=1 Tax=Vibrio alginolyticus TaxID=663 RepID=A0A7Y0MZY4_VIBAL|nr:MULTISPECIES: hypothetical protein [Vibrio]MDW2204290.1 hypothetical protein [Vibrio sp. 1636]NMR76226.1 hypothetical protein [Vibrio alginolyticus]